MTSTAIEHGVCITGSSIYVVSFQKVSENGDRIIKSPKQHTRAYKNKVFH